MKAILLTIITIAITTNMFAMEATAENKRLCKVFEEKVTTYKKTMRDDEYAMKTLTSYEKRAELYCSNK